MSAKVYDGKGRWCNKYVGFRVSDEDDKQIEAAVALSGLTKQDYIIRKLQDKAIVVHGSPRVYKALRNIMTEILEELKRLDSACDADEEFLALLRLVAETASGMNNAAQAETATEILSKSNIATEKTISCVSKHKI